MCVFIFLLIFLVQPPPIFVMAFFPAVAASRWAQLQWLLETVHEVPEANSFQNWKNSHCLVNGQYLSQSLSIIVNYTTCFFFQSYIFVMFW